MLGDWGRAVLDGRLGRADSVFARLAVAGDSVARLGADRTLPRLVAWLATVRATPRHRASAARAAVQFARGVWAIDDGRFEEAERASAEAEHRFRSLGAPLGEWAALSRAVAEANQWRFAEADRRLRRIADGAAPREPALRAQAMWMRGTVALRQGDFEAATRWYAASRPWFVRARDAKREASVSYVLTEGLMLAGQTDASFAEAYRGLQRLHAYRQSVNLHNHLVNTALLARGAGLRYAARDLMDEALAVSPAVGRADVLVFGLCTRARDLAAVGDSAAAFADLDSAARVTRRLVGVSRRLGAASVDLARGQLLRARDPRGALALLTRAADSYRAMGVWRYESAALYEVAAVARDAGRVDVARSRLRQAIALVGRPSGAFASVESRAAFDESVERVFDAMITLELDAGRPAVAYEYLERERAAVWTGGAGPAPPRAGGCGAPCALAAVARAAPRDLLFVSYAVLPDRVALWFSSRRGVGFRSVPYARDSLAALVRQFGRERSGTGAAEFATRARLYDVLLGPVRDELRDATHLTLVPDRELAGLPFGALWDDRTRRYLVADHDVRTAPSGAFARAAWRQARPAGARAAALVVGNPALDSGAVGPLAPLPGADDEARAVARLYPRSRLLTGARATRSAVTGALARAPVFHFAGHAVFDGARPERSYLALAAGAPRRAGDWRRGKSPRCGSLRWTWSCSRRVTR
jgi:tetratricopeptide (TPR) repeat protein